MHAELTSGSCEFTRESGAQRTALRIEVAPAGSAHPHCGPGSDALRAIGNEAMACKYSGQAGWIAEQVTGRVRDQAFLVRVSSNDPAAARQSLREKARSIAEQVAGILF